MLSLIKCRCSGRSVIAWATPGVILALIPKCPLCIVAYIAVVGIGISVSAADYIRVGLLTFCFGAFLFLVVRWLLDKRPQPQMTQIKTNLFS